MLGGKRNKELVVHVFSSLQSLEKYCDNIKKLSSAKSADPVVTQHEKALKCMRRVANKIQLEIARNDWNSAVRSLKIFYGLNHMVRPDLVSTFVRLSGAQNSTPAQPESIYH